jgi:hypothetical protein
MKDCPTDTTGDISSLDTGIGEPIPRASNLLWRKREKVFNSLDYCNPDRFVSDLGDIMVREAFPFNL